MMTFPMLPMSLPARAATSAMRVRAGLQVAVIPRLVIRVPGAERPQADRREQLCPNHFQDRLPPIAVENRMVERNREDLVGPTRRVVPVRAIDHVPQVAPVRIPEAL